MLQPASAEDIANRLTAVWLATSHGKSEQAATAWLHEVGRLVRDLPLDIFNRAVDEALKETKFTPTVAEIRAKADPLLEDRRLKTVRLETMARLIASGLADKIEPAKPVGWWREADRAHKRAPDQPITAEEAEELNEIMAKVGARTRYRPDGSRYEVAKDDGKTERHRGPPRRPTREDYIALGVDPDLLDANEGGKNVVTTAAPAAPDQAPERDLRGETPAVSPAP